jgi:cell division protein FtsW
MSLDRFRPASKASPDYTYFSLAVILILFGLVMISSSSVVLSVEIYNQNYAYVIKQAIALGIGFIVAMIISRIDYRVWRRWVTPFLVCSLILLILVFIPHLGKSAKGAARWIDLGFFQLQPSELLKLSFILYLAAWLEKKGKAIKSFSEGLVPFLLLLAPIILLLIVQHDLGTLLIILGTSALMFFVAGATLSQIGIGGAIGLSLVSFLIRIAPYRLERLTTFLNPTEANKFTSGYHINQSLIAIGSGGLWGRGFGQSLQKYLYLPEPHTDSIFAIIVEELGFFRSILVLIVIGLLAYKGYQIALKASDGFGRMVAFGITTMLLLQAVLNIGAILGLIPLTGVPLPFISYGGTSLLASLVAVGLMLAISKYRYGD